MRRPADEHDPTGRLAALHESVHAGVVHEDVRRAGSGRDALLAGRRARRPQVRAHIAVLHGALRFSAASLTKASHR
jgi:hypothetical protein